MLKMLKTLTPRLASSTFRDLQVDDLGRSEELKVMSQEQWVDKKRVEWIKVFAPLSAYGEARFLPSPFQVTSFPCLAQLTRKLLSSLVPFEIIPLLHSGPESHVGVGGLVPLQKLCRPSNFETYSTEPKIMHWFLSNKGWIVMAAKQSENVEGKVTITEVEGVIEMVFLMRFLPHLSLLRLWLRLRMGENARISISKPT